MAATALPDVGSRLLSVGIHHRLDSKHDNPEQVQPSSTEMPLLLPSYKPLNVLIWVVHGAIVTVPVATPHLEV